MSATTPDATTDARWTAHGLEKWHNARRNDVHMRDPDRGWRESVHVDYPGARDGARGRYHVDGEIILIVKDHITSDGRQPVIVTCINLDDRPVWEREYVRCQVEFGGGDDE